MSERTAPVDAAWTARQATLVVSLFMLSLITYVDRAAIATAKEPISRDLLLNDASIGLVFGVFALGYALTQVPCGWLADRWGSRIVLAISVALWSLLTSLTGVAWSLASLVAIRFMFGMGEAAVFPGSARAIRDWLSAAQRGRANGALFAGSRIGAALSYPLFVLLLQRWQWRVGFLLLGVLGVLWAVGWWMWYRDVRIGAVLHDDHAPSPRPGNAALARTEYSGIARLLTQYFASNFTNFVCLSWMFPYLQTRFALSSADAALYSMPPLLLGATALGLTGMMVDRMYVSRHAVWSRRAPAVAGFCLAAMGLIALTQAGSLHAAVVAFTISIFGADMTIGPSWVVCVDIGATRTGRLSGSMNMLGSIGAFASANAFPFLHRVTGSSSAYFLIAAGLDVVGLLCWLSLRSLRVDPHTGVPMLHSEFA